jgi:hypothetical protein
MHSVWLGVLTVLKLKGFGNGGSSPLLRPASSYDLSTSQDRCRYLIYNEATQPEVKARHSTKLMSMSSNRNSEMRDQSPSFVMEISAEQI